MKAILVLSIILAVGFSHSLKLEEQILRDLWDQWKINHDKVYAMDEEHARFGTFAQNYLQILEFNALNNEVTLGLNAFADLSVQEFEAEYLGFKATDKKEATHVETQVFDTTDLPQSVDWRQKGAVNEVKNQGKCGSCWTFSAVAALEGLHFIDSGKLESFSEQNLVDCAHGFGESNGCNGGLMSDAFDYTAENGIQLEGDYPYTAKTGTCHAVKSQALNVNIAYKNVTVSTEQLKAAIAQQPVSVAVQAGGLPWQFYRGGVIRYFCGDKLNHGITAVGYGKEKGSEAFIVRNSWGPTWGDKGYVHISTEQSVNGGHGVCGILADNSFPVSK